MGNEPAATKKAKKYQGIVKKNFHIRIHREGLVKDRRDTRKPILCGKNKSILPSHILRNGHIPFNFYSMPLISQEVFLSLLHKRATTVWQSYHNLFLLYVTLLITTHGDHHRYVHARSDHINFMTYMVKFMIILAWISLHTMSWTCMSPLSNTIAWNTCTCPIHQWNAIQATLYRHHEAPQGFVQMCSVPKLLIYIFRSCLSLFMFSLFLPGYYFTIIIIIIVK